MFSLTLALTKISPWYFDEDIPYVTSTGSGKISRFDLWLKKDNDFAGHECHIAKDMIFINWNGDCYKCPNDQWSNVQPVMNIQSVDFDSKEYFENKGSIDFEDLCYHNKISYPLFGKECFYIHSSKFPSAYFLFF